MKLLSKPLLYFYTLKNLKPIQIYGRLLHRYWPQSLDTVSPAPHVGDFAFVTTPLLGPRKMLSDKEFFFLNEHGHLDDKESWNSKSFSQLWLFNLHYFDDLNSENFQKRFEWHKKYIHRWINENPPPLGNGWMPYPISLRVVDRKSVV